MLAINEKDSMILSMKIYEKYIYMKYWDNSGFLARIEDKGITVLLEWDAYLDNKNENILYELYQQNGSCKVYYQPIGEIDILSSYSLR